MLLERPGRYHHFRQGVLTMKSRARLFCGIFLIFFITDGFSTMLYARSLRLVSGDKRWSVITSGSTVQKIVAAPQEGSPWGVLIPNSAAQWMYTDNFDTGLLREQSQWVVKTFRYDFGSQIPKDRVVSARIKITADNGYVLRVNGQEVGRTFFPNNIHEKKPIFPVDWHTVNTYEVKQFLSPSANYIEIDVADYGIVAGLLVDVFFDID